jgi:Epoxide hydrolase N terminus
MRTQEKIMRAVSLDRRSFLAALAAAGAVGLLHLQPVAAAKDETIRSFRVSVPDEQLADLRRRIAATRWPDRETVANRSQGVQLAKLQELVHSWGTDYDWRKAETKLNALPQFITEIDGLDIHFIHVRSRHPNAMPLIMTHGWPGSVFELLKSVGPLTDRQFMGDARKTPSTSSCRRCPVLASPASRKARAGIPIVSLVPGPN